MTVSFVLLLLALSFKANLPECKKGFCYSSKPNRVFATAASPTETLSLPVCLYANFCSQCM